MHPSPATRHFFKTTSMSGTAQQQQCLFLLFSFPLISSANALQRQWPVLLFSFLPLSSVPFTHQCVNLDLTLHHHHQNILLFPSLTNALPSLTNALVYFLHSPTRQSGPCSPSSSKPGLCRPCWLPSTAAASHWPAQTYTKTCKRSLEGDVQTESVIVYRSIQKVKQESS